MAVDFRDESFPILKEYLTYQGTVRQKSKKTVSEYFLDLRMFFRYLKLYYKIVPKDTEFEEIDIKDIDIDFLKRITLNDAYEFMSYLYNDRELNASSRARKCSSLKGFFKYITKKKHYLSSDPVEELELPKKKKALPKYLTLEQSIELLNAVEGAYKERDYAIITLFLNCGMRLSELVGINMNDIMENNMLRIFGKGRKERIVYLNEACNHALQEYLKVRPENAEDKNALFISKRNKRISKETVQFMVYKYIDKIGLGEQGYSVHKLRHTAATLMYQHGNVDIRVLKDVLGHEHLDTTEIYTHLSSKQVQNAINANPLANLI